MMKRQPLLAGLLATGALLVFGAPAYADQYEIRNFGSGMCAGLNSWEYFDNGAPVVQLTCDGSPEQLWAAVPVGDGYYMFVNARSGKCMDVRDGKNADWTPVQQWACTNTNGMKWRATVSPIPQWQWVTTRLGVTRPAAPGDRGRCLDVRSGSLEERAAIQIYQCSSWTSYNTAQIFALVLR